MKGGGVEMQTRAPLIAEGTALPEDQRSDPSGTRDNDMQTRHVTRLSQRVPRGTVGVATDPPNILQTIIPGFEGWRDERSLPPSKMVLRAGNGPAGKKCKHCTHCFGKRFYRKTYYKCELLGDTNGPGTDIRLSWDACSLFKEEIEG